MKQMNWYQAGKRANAAVQELEPAWHIAVADGKVTVAEMLAGLERVVKAAGVGNHVICAVDPKDDVVDKGLAGAAMLTTILTGIFLHAEG